MKRRGRPSLLLQERDLDMLRALFACRFLSTSQIQQVFFGRNRSVVCERLNKKLLPHGIVQRHFPELAFHYTDAVYSVGKTGITLLAEVLQAEAQTLERGREQQLEPLFLRHLLEVNDVWAALRMVSREEQTSCRLLSWWTEKKLRGLRRTAYTYPIADSRFVLGYQDGSRAHFFVEVDRGTEAPRVFQQKVSRYLAYFVDGGHARDFGPKVFRVLTIVPEERRLQRLMQTAAEVGANNIFLFTTKGMVAAQGILGEIWSTPRDRFALTPKEGGRFLLTGKDPAAARTYSIAQ